MELKAQLRNLGCEVVSRTAGCEMLDKINYCNSGFPGLESQKVTASEQDTHLPDVHLPTLQRASCTAIASLRGLGREGAGAWLFSCPWPQPGLPGWVLPPRAGPQEGSRSLKRCGMAGQQRQRLPWSRADVLRQWSRLLPLHPS